MFDPLLVAPLQTLQTLQLMEECSTSLQYLQQNACMAVWMGYITSWLSHIEISSTNLAPEFRVSISTFTTVVINCKLRYARSCIPLRHLQKDNLKYPTNVASTPSSLISAINTYPQHLDIERMTVSGWMEFQP